MRVWWLLLLLLPGVAAQPGPDVAIVVYHPFPDDADPLGIDRGGRDPFFQRNARFDTDGDGFDFPTFVADGMVFVEGLPASRAGEDALEATLRAYKDGVAMRAALQSPIALEVRSTVMDEQVRFVITPASQTDLSGDDLSVWYAVVEDPVHYQPPPALSNGVFEHPFVARAVGSLGSLGTSSEFRATWPLVGDVENLWLAVWVEQSGASGTRFASGEVVQAAFHPLTRDLTVQTQRAVLVEAYSASWCAPCLIGDRALEVMAADAGIERPDAPVASQGYFVAPGWWVWIAVVVVAVAGASVRMPGGRP